MGALGGARSGPAVIQAIRDPWPKARIEVACGSAPTMDRSVRSSQRRAGHSVAGRTRRQDGGRARADAPRRAVVTTRKPTRRRAGIVWASFAFAMTGLLGVLSLGDPDAAPPMLTNVTAGPVAQPRDQVLELDVELDPERWQRIVLHDLGRPTCPDELLALVDSPRGDEQGRGYHFVIGNGNGLGDGLVMVTRRWRAQQAGRHVAAGADTSIGICLVGQGDRIPFTPRQLDSLAALVRRLQSATGLPREAVLRHSDLAGEGAGPGRYFPLAGFADRLRD